MRSMLIAFALASLISSACRSDESGLATEPAPAPADDQPSTSVRAPTSPEHAEARVELAPEPTTADPLAAVTEDGAPAADGEAQPEAPADPLAPILPSGPEPGSPEADAELAELLEESTLTQEEFDQAFRDGGPKIEGDQFVFGPNERTRKPPPVDAP